MHLGSFKLLKVLLTNYLLIFSFIPAVNAQILFKTDNPEILASKLISNDSSGIKIKNVHYSGDPLSIAAYYCSSDKFPVKNGLMLCTGVAERAGYPNESSSSGTARFTPGDKRLERLAKGYTTDAAILEVTFVANSDEVSFVYFFASEEYPEFVNKGVNDVFAFWIEGPGYDQPYNMAVLPETGDPITVDHVNEERNSSYYISNPFWIPWTPENPNPPAPGEFSYIFQYDGMTIALPAKAKVQAYQTYTLTMAIADVGDNIYDSGVFIKSRSLKSSGKKQPINTGLSNELNIKNNLIEFNNFHNTGDSIKFSKSIKFDFNSYEILPDDTLALDEIATILNQYFDAKIKLIGHTDDVGTQQYNLDLSLLRAKAVGQYFIENGIAVNRIKMEGKGKSRPVDKSNTEVARKKNRRVEFIIY